MGKIIYFDGASGELREEDGPDIIETPEEVAVAVTARTEAANKKTVEQKLATKLESMQTILDQTNADLRTDPSQEIKELARAVRLIVRIITDQLDGVE